MTEDKVSAELAFGDPEFRRMALNILSYTADKAASVGIDPKDVVAITSILTTAIDILTDHITLRE